MHHSDSIVDRLTSLFQRHYGLVSAAARRYAPSSDYVDDIVQQVYIEFIRGAIEEKWDIRQDMAPLLYQIAKRRAQNTFRKHRRESNRPFDELAERLLAKDDEEEQENLEQTNLHLDSLRCCIEKLPPKSRAILEQHYFTGIPMKDIAVQLQQSETSIYRFFFRIRSKLRDCILRLSKNR